MPQTKLVAQAAQLDGEDQIVGLARSVISTSSKPAIGGKVMGFSRMA